MASTPRKKKNQPEKNSTPDGKISKSEYPYILIEPDRPDIWEKAGFGRQRIGKGKKAKDIIFIPKDKTKLSTLYQAEGECEFYSARFFGGIIHTQLIPLIQLADFLARQIKIDNEEGKFYDLITLKENGRDAWGAHNGFQNTSQSAEEFLLYLEQYKRHGALIGEGGSYEYIQVCYIILG